MSFQLTVEGFANAGPVPKRHTCDGADLSPAVRWSGVPPEARSLALVLEDPDAPSGTFTHWMLWDIPPSVDSLPSGFGSTPDIKAGRNDFGVAGYRGPCPPRGHGPHRYYVTMYALAVDMVKLEEGSSRLEFDRAVLPHVVAQVQRMGRYERRS
ncbi:MAG: YbhB/YbcL family Raf kinase inhibitor-like protein [Bryobacteraceae bacterium]